MCVAPREGSNVANELDVRATRFATVPAWIADFGPHAVLVYFALALHADYGDKSCHPTQGTIAKWAGISERSVRSALKVLREGGAVTVQAQQRANGSRTSDRYWLHADPPGHGEAP